MIYIDQHTKRKEKSITTHIGSCGIQENKEAQRRFFFFSFKPEQGFKEPCGRDEILIRISDDGRKLFLLLAEHQ